MKKIIALLVLAILSFSLCLPLVVHAIPEQTVALPGPLWLVVVAAASGLLLGVGWSAGMGILFFYAEEIGKPPPYIGGFFGYLNLNNINAAHNEYALTNGITLTSSYSQTVGRTRKAFNAVTAYNKPILLMG